jgi:hypothetical protein
MKKVLLALAVVMLVGSGIEVNAAMARKKALGAATGETKASGAVQGGKVVVATEPLAPDELTEREKNTLTIEIKKLHQGIVKMAMGRLNQEDALAFLNAVDQFTSDLVQELGAAAAEGIKQRLPSKG